MKKTKISTDVNEVEKLQAKLDISNLSIEEAELLEQVFTITIDHLNASQKFVEKRRRDGYTIQINKLNCSIRYARVTGNTERVKMLQQEKDKLMKQHREAKERK